MSDEKQQERRQKTAREVAFDGMCSTIAKHIASGNASRREKRRREAVVYT